MRCFVGSIGTGFWFYATIVAIMFILSWWPRLDCILQHLILPLQDQGKW